MSIDCYIWILKPIILSDLSKDKLFIQVGLLEVNQSI